MRGQVTSIRGSGVVRVSPEHERKRGKRRSSEEGYMEHVHGSAVAGPHMDME